MPILKSFSTLVGTFRIETLDVKAPPQRIPSRQKEHGTAAKDAMKALRNLQLHSWVLGWVENNLDDEAQDIFHDALGKGHYSDAHRVLIDTFYSNGRVTFRERNRFDRWIANFDRGFLINP